MPSKQYRSLWTVYRSRRQIAIPNRFQNCFIDSTFGHRAETSSYLDILNQIYLPLIDSILVELNDRLSCKTLSLLKSISTVYPESEHFLNSEAVDGFCCLIDTDPNLMKNEFTAIKPMLQSRAIADVIDFLGELIPLSSAFSQWEWWKVPSRCQLHRSPVNDLFLN